MNARTLNPSTYPKGLSYEEKLYQLKLARTQNVGSISFFHLLRRFGNAQEALHRLPEVVRRCPSGLVSPSMDDVRRELEAHEKQGFLLVSFYEPDYPNILRTLQDPPPFLSIRGKNLHLLTRHSLAVVGSRNASQAGGNLTTRIVEALALQKWIVVSGLARGIDAVAHEAALSEGTIAVVAGGVGHIYPPENKRLYEKITDQGLILSEDPLHEAPRSVFFPKRNRLISGLCWGVLVVEATLKSGSLMTAKYAADQGRLLFAVPGHPLDPRSHGVNRLLKQGACLVESADDIFEEYMSSHSRSHLAETCPDAYDAAYSPESQGDGEDFTESKESSDIDDAYERIYNLLTMSPVSMEDLAHHSQIPLLVVRRTLVEMELEGKIQRYPGNAVLLSGYSQETHSRKEGDDA